MRRPLLVWMPCTGPAPTLTGEPPKPARNESLVYSGSPGTSEAVVNGAHVFPSSVLLVW